jgi:hypothetical protein
VSVVGVIVGEGRRDPPGQSFGPDAVPLRQAGGTYQPIARGQFAQRVPGQATDGISQETVGKARLYILHVLLQGLGIEAVLGDEGMSRLIEGLIQQRSYPRVVQHLIALRIATAIA